MPASGYRYLKTSEFPAPSSKTESKDHDLDLSMVEIRSGPWISKRAFFPASRPSRPRIRTWTLMLSVGLEAISKVSQGTARRLQSDDNDDGSVRSEVDNEVGILSSPRWKPTFLKKK